MTDEMVTCSHADIDSWIEMTKKSPSTMKIWFWLMSRSNRRNVVHVAIRQVMAGAKVSHATVYRAMRLLDAAGMISRDGTAIRLILRAA